MVRVKMVMKFNKILVCGIMDNLIVLILIWYKLLFLEKVVLVVVLDNMWINEILFCDFN